MNRLSLRWVLLVPILVTIAGGFAIFAVYVDRVEHNNRIADIDEELVRAGTGAATRLEPAPRPDDAQPDARPDSPPAAPPAAAPAPEAGDPTAERPVERPVEILVDSQGRIRAAGPAPPIGAEGLRDLATEPGTYTIESVNYRVRVVAAADETLSITALSLDPLDQAARDFRQALFIGATLVMLVVAAVVWLLTSRLIRPVSRIATSATAIADGDLDTNIAASGGSRELTNLGTDLNRMLAQLRATIDASEHSALEASTARNDMQRFLADMSHELRTPLTALKGYSDLYAAGMLESTDDVDRAMSRIGNESERLATLANTMLQLAREDPVAWPREPVHIADIASDVVDDLRAAYPTHTIEIDVATGDASTVMGDRDRFHQVLVNLGANACQHSEPTEPIQLTIHETGDAPRSVVVRVIDHGPGIAPEHREQIFLPFYRVDAARDRTGSAGAGLGLALAHHITDQHDGTIAVEDTPGGGATFVLHFPMATPGSSS